MEKGLESLRAAVMKDCEGGENCFSENGCTKKRYGYVPQDNPKMLDYGVKESCVALTKCTHDYCGKYKWVLERAKHYAEKTNSTVEEVLAQWEKDRGYWYMNYYQDCNQPLLSSSEIVKYDDWQASLKTKFGDDVNQWAFKCPSCGGRQTIGDFIENGIDNEIASSVVAYNCIGRYVKGKGCDWSLGGLLQIHKLSVLKDGIVIPVFETAEK